MTSKHILIVAGEASGDLHASHLVEELRKLKPSLTFSGVGGPLMQKAGVELYADLTKIAVAGFVEVLKHFMEFRRVFHLVLGKVRAAKPDAVILVDYPGFNLRLAKELKKLGVKVIYYISPQVWAWKENRVEAIRRDVDKMLVLFQFEKEFYAKRGLDVEFVGHPLIDSIKVTKSRKQFLESVGLSDNKLTVGLLPGSRRKEIENLLPAMLEAADILNREFNGKIQFLLLKTPHISTDLVAKYLRSNIVPNLRAATLPLKIVEGQTYDGVNASDVCLVASGTATLETAILGKPMVVAYKTSLLTYWIAKRLVKIPDIALVNVVAQKRIVAECVQCDVTGPKLAAEVRTILTSEAGIAKIKSGLAAVKESLGGSGASKRAAEAVLKILN